MTQPSKPQTPEAHDLAITKTRLARIEDTATYPEDKAEASFTLGDMVAHKDFIAALADPVTGPDNLNSIWDNNIKKLCEDDGEDDDAWDESLKIAENRSATGFAVTTLRVVAPEQEKDISVHIVLNNDTGKGLIVGDRIAPGLKEAFNAAGIAYVDRHAKDAKATAEAALAALTGKEYTTMMYLKDAFGYRNDTYEDNRPLAALLVDDRVEPMFGKYVVKKPLALRLRKQQQI